MQRTVPNWLVVVVAVLVVLIIVSIFAWRRRATAPSSEPPAIPTTEAQY